MPQAVLIGDRHVDVDILSRRLIKARRALAKAKLKFMMLTPGEQKIELSHAIAKVTMEMKRLEAIIENAPRFNYYNGEMVPANTVHGNGHC
jgi:hypothetical protein